MLIETLSDKIVRGCCLGRQFDAALAATCREDGTSRAGAHTKTEAVLLGTTAIIRLKSPLAHVGLLQDNLKKRLARSYRGKNRPTRRIRYLPVPVMGTCRTAHSRHKGLHHVRSCGGPQSNGQRCSSPRLLPVDCAAEDEIAPKDALPLPCCDIYPQGLSLLSSADSIP